MKALRPLALIAFGALAACSIGSADDQPTNDAPITTVDDTAVKNQSIGNCWLYATAGWVESMHLVATKETIDVSEGYWSFWYWFEEITGGDLGLSSQWGIAENKTVGEGGWWGIGAELIVRYGWMNEADFFPGADKDAKAARHKEAVDAVNASLRSGPLKDVLRRKDKKFVLEELARIWKLEPAAVSDLEKLCGAHVERNLASKLTETESTIVHRASEMKVPSADGIRTITLADVVGTREIGSSAAEGRRAGPDAWSEVQYLWGSDAEGAARRQAIVRNVQDTLHRRLAIPVAWAVGTSQNGVYSGDQTYAGGLHESLIVDYQVENVPGFGQLPVGVPVNNPAALEAALSPEAHVTLFRIKNSWGEDPFFSEEEWRQFGGGTPRPTTAKDSFLAAKPGYNDLTTQYLDSDIQTSLNWRVDPHNMLGVALPNALRFPIPAQAEPRRMFVTQTAYRGSDLFGVDGADKACQQSATRGSIKGNFKAYLSAMGEEPYLRFDYVGHRYMAVQRAFGRKMTFRTQFSQYPGFDEYGIANTGGVWVGRGATDGSTSCGGWSKDGTGSTNQGATLVACTQRRQLLCIQDR